MKKIFLLDDEVQVREGIQRSINWQKEGFEYCGDAPDGEIALPLIEKYKPDIVITDIKMPFMDGFEVSRILREKMPWIKIIILSGHDEFEYAREAMRIQIYEYCLKPISSTDLLTTLHNVSKQIDLEEIEKRRLDELENQVFKSESFSRDLFLNELCEGAYTASEAIKHATELDIDLISSYYCTFIIESEKIDDFPFEWLNEQICSIQFKRKSKEAVFILKGDSRDKLEQQITTVKDKLLNMTKRSSDHPILFGFGKIEVRIRGIATSFSDAEEEKSYYRVLQSYTSKNFSGEPLQADLHVFNRKELIHFLRFGEVGNIPSFSLSYSAYLKDAKTRTPFFTYYFLLDFTMTIKHYLMEMDTDPTTIHELNKMEVNASWVREYPEMLIYIREMLQLIIESRDQMTTKFSPTIIKAKDYVKDHFNDSQLSLQTIANIVNVSPSYFSHMFSQETGQTLIEYITMIRIEHAKELLKTTNDKTYEVAHKVGYSDSHYFCNLFKKVTGMTTREFKAHRTTFII